MDLAVLLLILRLAGALILFLFLGVIAWLIYQDIHTATATVGGGQGEYGILRVVQGEEGAEGESHPLLPVTSIGRAPGNTIVLEDDFVSNEHTLLMLRGQQWWVEDLNSRNGTFLNGTPLAEPTIVSPGDLLTIGQTELKVEPAQVQRQQQASAVA